MSTKYVKGKKKGKPPVPPQYGAGSESDQSLETNSLSAESQDAGRSPNNPPKAPKKDEWEILEGLKEGQRFEFVPNKFEGFLSKRRKWPLKGWHKRYFILDKAVLIYAKNPAELARGKKHGTVDIAMSVVSTKAKRRRIDIDADSSILHVKCKSREIYMQWVEQLKQHRLHKQHKLLYMKPRLSPISPEDSPTDPLLPSGLGSLPQSLPNSLPNTLTRDAKQCLTPGISRGSLPGTGALRSWLMDNSSLENIGKTINGLQHHVDQLSTAVATADGNSEEPATPSTKKRGGKFRLRKHKSTKSSGSTSDIYPEKQAQKGDVPDSCKTPNTLQIEGNLVDLRPLSTSNPALSPQSSNVATIYSSRPHSCSDANAAANPATASLPSAQSAHPLIESQMPAISLDDGCAPINGKNEGFINKANYVVGQMNSVLRSLQAEKERARRALETESSHVTSHNPTAVIASLRLSLNQALQQNAELRGRLNRIHEDSNITDICSPPTTIDVMHKSLRNSRSYESSSCFSVSEYFDAQDNKGATSDTSSEVSSDNSSITSETSETGTDAMPSVTENDEGKCFTGRRTCLPVPQATCEDFSLFNLLYKNIGKDLSKLSMPVTLNEPLNMLQRLCEELEYSELLDKANNTDDPSERMVQVAAFAVSAYASSIHRAAHKPFNPLLGETYECIREDKGFRFVAEQVSHHPPISVSHAQSNNYIFWQDLRIKTKFWGRSLEFQPSGKASLYLPNYDEHYEWNKVTTCVHNLFGSGTRWVDQYGEMVIVNKKAALTCKLSFVKASSITSKRHEVFGTIQDSTGRVIHNLFGKWTEALYCGHAPSARVVWRPGSMPDGYELYYGFTRYAIELNEVDHDLGKILPPTDSRFRPDQRFLEEGKVPEAESMKVQLEQHQRERRKLRESDGTPYIPMWFRTDSGTNSEGSWVFGGEYWNKRKDPAFVNMSFDPIW